MAERGPIKHTRAPVDITPGDDGRASDNEMGGSKSSSNPDPRKRFDKHGPKGQTKPHGKKYVNMKLIDFGARSRPSASGGKATIRGDAFLTLLLFESDGFDKLTGEDGSVKKIYQGGSKGAFEVMSRLKEGDVVALLNPKILKPLQVCMFRSFVASYKFSCCLSLFSAMKRRHTPWTTSLRLPRSLQPPLRSSDGLATLGCVR